MPITIHQVDHRDDDFGLGADEVALLWRMEEKHFWHRARNAWIVRALRGGGVLPPASVLEVGCGSGAVASHLVEAGYRLTGIDTNEPLVRKAFERCPEGDFTVGFLSELDGGPFDAIGYFDVLEHLDEPGLLLKEGLARARPGTLVVATVPAQAALHTVIDDLSGHKRRYEAGELAALFSSVGLSEVQERGIFRYLVPVQRLARSNAQGKIAGQLSDEERDQIWRKNFQIPPLPLDRTLGALCALERGVGWERARDRPGASLLCVGRVA